MTCVKKHNGGSHSPPQAHDKNAERNLCKRCRVGAVPRQVCWKTLCIRPQAGRYIFRQRGFAEISESVQSFSPGLERLGSTKCNEGGSDYPGSQAQYDPGSRPKASRSPDTSGRAHLHLLADPNSKFKTQNSRWVPRAICHQPSLPVIASHCQPLPAFPRTKFQPSFLSKTLKTLGKSASFTHQSTTNSQPLPAPWQMVAPWPMALPSPAGLPRRSPLAKTGLPSVGLAKEGQLTPSPPNGPSDVAGQCACLFYDALRV